MLAWLMLRPKMIAGVGALALVGSLWAAWKWEVRGLNKTIAKQEMALTHERAVSADLQFRLREVLEQAEKNRLTLTAEITRQNDRIALWQSTATALEQAAARRALEVLRAREKIAEAIKSGHTHIEPGHTGVNQFLQERFP